MLTQPYKISRLDRVQIAFNTVWTIDLKSYRDSLSIQIKVWTRLMLSKARRFVRAGVCRPCVETKLTATEKSATDGN